MLTEKIRLEEISPKKSLIEIWSEPDANGLEETVLLRLLA